MSGGVSNMSFSFRGNKPVREAMHSVFLYHAIHAGMDMGIVNAGQLDGLRGHRPRSCCERVEDVHPQPPRGRHRAPARARRAVQGQGGEAERGGPGLARASRCEKRLEHALIKGIDQYVEDDTEECAPARSTSPSRSSRAR
ncbi:MAG: dihydropteroate synthase [Arhodomonas sp.]|nr:dihydropteroate synthase [Arhodomonas sp.]